MSLVQCAEERSHCYSQELRIFLDHLLFLDTETVVNTVRALTLNTLSSFQSGASVPWNDAELAVYLVYIYGEVNKSLGLLLSIGVLPSLNYLKNPPKAAVHSVKLPPSTRSSGRPQTMLHIRSLPTER